MRVRGLREGMAGNAPQRHPKILAGWTAANFCRRLVRGIQALACKILHCDVERKLVHADAELHSRHLFYCPFPPPVVQEMNKPPPSRTLTEYSHLTPANNDNQLMNIQPTSLRLSSPIHPNRQTSLPIHPNNLPISHYQKIIHRRPLPS